jgi:superfamily II DNA/RNA helicase
MEKKNIIIDALTNAGITELNKMQQQALDTCRNNQDVVLLSPTGSGKTLAFLLPVLELLDVSKEKIQVLILAPSRELVLQITEVFKSFRSGYRIGSFYGGHDMLTEKNVLRNHPTIIVGTPGRIGDHLRRGNLTTDSIRILILDEFDKMLELGFTEELSFITFRLKKLMKRILVSATEPEEIPSFTSITNPARLDFLTQKETLAGLNFRIIISPQKDKLETLHKLLIHLTNKPALVFCNYRESVERTEEFLKEKGIFCCMYHGGMEQPEREKSLFLFQSGCCPVLISTDLASRGLDIPLVENIIHYHFPVNEEAFIHRNGRTARMFAEGTSYIIRHETEVLPDFMNMDYKIEILNNNISEAVSVSEWDAIYIGKGKKDKISKGDVAGFLIKKGELKKEEIGKIEVKDKFTYVAVKRKVADRLIKIIEKEKIKGNKTIYRKIIN